MATNAKKVVVVGDSLVGKSVILRRFSHNEFQDKYEATIGVEFQVRRLSVGEQELALQLWDTAGQERFRNVISSYYKTADAVIIVFDVTAADSYENVEMWFEHVSSHIGSGAKIFLVGNKADLLDLRQVEYKIAEEFASSQHMQYWEVSAKSGQNVNELFDQLARSLVDKDSGQATSLK